MMRASEWIADPNVAAFYVFHAGWRMIVYRPNPMPRSRWGDLFTWWAGMPEIVKPNECRRIGPATIYAGEAFARRIDLYLNSYRLEARERVEDRRTAA